MSENAVAGVPLSPDASRLAHEERIWGVVLVAEDEASIRDSIGELLREEGHAVVAVADGVEAIAALDAQEFDLVLSDLCMPRADGLAVLQHVRDVAPETPVLLTTARANVEEAVQAVRFGAHDYLLKPLVFEDVQRKVAHLLHHRQIAWENQLLRAEARWRSDGGQLVGQSSAMRQVMEIVQHVALTLNAVLVSGERGTWKEAVGRAIHQFSARRDRVFLPLSCAPAPQLESQLFGCLHGAGEGVSRNYGGGFRHARGGTVFLDDVAALAPDLQAKLLRVIETREVQPLGSQVAVPIDVRIIAATSTDLRAEVEAGRFLEPLYYRLKAVAIEIPPLRERREDIPGLVEHFVQRYNRELKSNFKGADAATLKLLMALRWKGNIRELQAVIAYAMMVGDGEWIRADDVRVALGDEGARLPAGDDLREGLRSYEKTHIEAVLAKVNQDRKAAARRLGVSLSSLYRKIAELNIGLARPGTS
jgi:DNA-binding NtrC family response regulator